MLDFYFCDPERAELFQTPPGERQSSADRSSAGAGELASTIGPDSPRQDEPQDSERKLLRVPSRDPGQQDEDRPRELPQLGRRAVGTELHASADAASLMTRVESTSAGSRSCPSAQARAEEESPVPGMLQAAIQTSVAEDATKNSNLQDLVRKTIMQELASSTELRDIVSDAVHEEILVSKQLREMVSSAVKDEVKVMMDISGELAELRELVYCTTHSELERLNGDMDLLRAEMLKLSAQAESVETRLNLTATKQEQDAATTMLVSRNAHLNNRMSQLMSFCSDVSQQGDKLRTRFDGVVRQLNMSRQFAPREDSKRSLCTEVVEISSKVEREASQMSTASLSTRTFTPQPLPSISDDFMPDMDLPEEGTAFAVRNATPSFQVLAPKISHMDCAKASSKSSPGSIASSSGSTHTGTILSREPSLSTA